MNIFKRIKNKFFGNKISKDNITYYPYAFDKAWLLCAKDVICDKTRSYPKYVFENYLEDLEMYKEEIKTDEALKMVIIEMIGDIHILIEKAKERIKDCTVNAKNSKDFSDLINKKTKKDYAKELRRLIKSVTKMHSEEFYDNYGSSKGVLKKIEKVLKEMENDED